MDKSICIPAGIYLILSLLSIIILVMNNFSGIKIFFKIIFVIFTTWLLNLFCKRGYGIISWIFILMPLIVTFFLGIFAYDFLEKILSNEDGFRKNYYLIY